MNRNWKLILILAGSALVGATAIAVARDLMSSDIYSISKTDVTYPGDEPDECLANACSIVLKSSTQGETSQVIAVR